MNISIIFPYYNEENTIQMTIKALAEQTMIPDEIIFVDSGSTDMTSDYIEDEKKNYLKLNIKRLYSGKMSPSSSVNDGIRQSRNDMIMYMDCGLKIPKNWIESQINIYKQEKADLVSATIYTEGINIIDKSFIAHTYGYKNKCICLTGSLFNKDILQHTGFFIENCRAGYDVDFINKLKDQGLTRIINRNINLEYYGANYSNTLMDGYKKVHLYSKSAWKAYGDNKPFIYLSVLSFLFIISLFSSCLSIYLLLSYFLLRGYAIPRYKSKNIFKEKNIKLFLLLPLVGLLFDIARVNGYLNGFVSK